MQTLKSQSAKLVRFSVVLTAAFCGTLLMATARVAQAAEIKVLCAGAMRAAMSELIPQFEKSSGHTVTIDYGSVGTMTDRIQKGEAADVILVRLEQIGALQKEGKVMPGNPIGIAKVGVFVRNGAPQPDVSSVDAFKRTLLMAKSITYPTVAFGAWVIYLNAELDRFGIADALKPKIVNFNTATGLFQAVARGDAEIGIYQLTEIAAATNVQFAGPLPLGVQSYTSFAIGIVANSQQTAAATAFISYVTSHTTGAFTKARGFDPF